MRRTLTRINCLKCKTTHSRQARPLTDKQSEADLDVWLDYLSQFTELVIISIKSMKTCLASLYAYLALQLLRTPPLW